MWIILDWGVIMFHFNIQRHFNVTMVFYFLAGLFFARRLHKGGYVSIMDVFQQKYGDTATVLLLVLHCINSVLYAAAIHTALGVIFIYSAAILTAFGVIFIYSAAIITAFGVIFIYSAAILAALGLIFIYCAAILTALGVIFIHTFFHSNQIYFHYKVV